MTNEITFEVLNDDGSITYEATKIVELPNFDTVEEFSSFISTAFGDLPKVPEVIVLV
jgi:hypothetical protein